MRKYFYIILLLNISACKENTAENKVLSGEELIKHLASNDEELGIPQKGEWLYTHKEPGQNLEEYIRFNPIKPDSIRNKIYLQPIGMFSKQQKKVVDYTADYLEIFFGLKTIVSKNWSDNILPKHARRFRDDMSEQLLAPYILDSLLIKRIPPDAIVVMAITAKDLYPNPDWNFVFGLASLKQRIGVSSIYRYSIDAMDSLNYASCLARLISTSSHEIGHMFGMKHCINAVCVMNGSNSLQESDSRPNRLCSQCLNKLSWNLGFNIKERLKRLAAFFLLHKLKWDHKVTDKDLEVLGLS